eukprot:5873815-Pleurochrysis_carterae.AAC.2
MFYQPDFLRLEATGSPSAVFKGKDDTARFIDRRCYVTRRPADGDIDISLAETGPVRGTVCVDTKQLVERYAVLKGKTSK